MITMFGKHLKLIPFYYGRFWGTNIAYRISYFFLLSIPFGILYLCSLFSNEFWLKVIDNVSFLFIFIIIIFVNKKSLNEIFLRPYKHFKLKPKFAKVTFLFATKFTIVCYTIYAIILRIHLATFYSFTSYQDIEKFFDSNCIHFLDIFVMWIISYPVEAFVLGYYVNKYANIEEVQ